MELATKSGKIVDITDNQIFSFPNGLLGFENYKKFALIETENEPFFLLQSLEEKNIAFFLVDPFLICNNYEADIDDDSLKTIQVTSPEDIIIMSILTIPNDNSTVTANLLGPVVFNKKNNKCVQVVLNDNRWTTKFDIIKALNSQGA